LDLNTKRRIIQIGTRTDIDGERKGGSGGGGGGARRIAERDSREIDISVSRTEIPGVAE